MSLGFPAPRRLGALPVRQPAAEPRDQAPQLDAHRALIAEAFIALIDATLNSGAPGSAVALLKRFVTSGHGEVTSGPDQMKLTLFKISATSGPSPSALLRNWQTAAADRISQGVRP
jgi:hypothetical protein